MFDYCSFSHTFYVHLGQPLTMHAIEIFYGENDSLIWTSNFFFNLLLLAVLLAFASLTQLPKWSLGFLTVFQSFSLDIGSFFTSF